MYSLMSSKLEAVRIRASTKPLIMSMINNLARQIPVIMGEAATPTSQQPLPDPNVRHSTLR